MSAQDELQCAEEKLQALKDEVQQLQAEKASQEERAQTAETKLEEYRTNCQVYLHFTLLFRFCMCSSSKSDLQACTQLLMRLGVKAS